MSRLSGRKKRSREEPRVASPSQKAARKAKGCRKGEVGFGWSACQRCGSCHQALKGSTGNICFCCSRPLCIECGKEVKYGIVCLDECYERWLSAAKIPDWQAWGEWEFMDDDSLDRFVKLLTIFEKPPFKLDPVTFANDPLARSNFSFLFAEETHGEEYGAMKDCDRATVGCVLRILGPGVAELSHIQRDNHNGLPGGGKRALMELVAMIQTWNREGSLNINKFFIPAAEDAVEKFWMRINGMEKMSAAEIEEMFRTYRLSVGHDHEFRHMTTWLKWDPFALLLEKSSRSTQGPVEKRCVQKCFELDEYDCHAKCLEKLQDDTIQKNATPCALLPKTTKLDDFATPADIPSAFSTKTPFSLPWEVPQDLETTPYDEGIGIWEVTGRTIQGLHSGDRHWQENVFWGDDTSESSYGTNNGSSGCHSDQSPYTKQSEELDDGDDDQDPHGSSQGGQADGGSVFPAESVETVVADVEPSGDGSHPSAAVEVSTPNAKASDDQCPHGEATIVSSLFFDLF